MEQIHYGLHNLKHTVSSQNFLYIFFLFTIWSPARDRVLRHCVFYEKIYWRQSSPFYIYWKNKHIFIWHWVVERQKLRNEAKSKKVYRQIIFGLKHLWLNRSRIKNMNFTWWLCSIIVFKLNIEMIIFTLLSFRNNQFYPNIVS